MSDVCCDGGGALQLRCQLCPNSPTYWRRCPVCGHPIDLDDRGALPASHPQCVPAEPAQNGAQS